MLRRLLYLLILLVIIFGSFQWVPSNLTENMYIGIAFSVGVIASFFAMQFVYDFKSVSEFKNYQSATNENPIFGFLKKISVPLFGVSLITLLCIQYLLTKPVIDFTDGQFAMAKVDKIREMPTHRGTKFEVSLHFLNTQNEKISSFDMIFPAELKWVEDRDSVPIAYSAAQPQKIVIITSDDKLLRIQAGK